MSYPIDHDTHTLDPYDCGACRVRMAQDEHRHSRVSSFYARFHLLAVGADVKLGAAKRIEAYKALTAASYPLQARRNAAKQIVRLTDLQYQWRRNDEA